MTSPLADFPPSWELSPFLDDVPAASDDDILALLPGWLVDNNNDLQAQIIDSLVEAFAKFASALAAYAAEGDPANATDNALDLHGRGRDVLRQIAEDDPLYRVRVLGDTGLITPAAIIAAINKILAPFTTKSAYYWEEPNDGVFLHSMPLDPVSNLPTFDPTNPVHLLGYYLRSWSTDLPRIQQVQNPFRSYVARSAVADCTPTHGLLFDAAPDVTPDFSLATPIGLPTAVTPNIGGGFNQRNHVIVALPQLTKRGDLDSEAYGHSMSLLATLANTTAIPPMIDKSGNFTPAAQTLIDLTDAVFSVSALGGPWPDGTPLTSYTGPSVWSAGNDPELVVAAVRQLLETRGMWPVHYTIFIDPTL